MLGFVIIFSITCCIGIPLNGIVIWLLGFQIKRNPFTVLILNLAIADFGFLASLAILCIYYFINPMALKILSLIIHCLFHIMYINSLFLLTAISIDRCMVALFPMWHCCSRPKHLSPVVCAIIWIGSVLFVGISDIIDYVFDYTVFSNLYLIATAVLCLPLITISTLILFVKICLKPKQIKRGRMLVMILITLLCSLILNLPLNIYGLYVLHLYMTKSSQDFQLHEFITLGSALNSTVNPVIYYLVGRKKQAQTRESINVVFQRVFKEDETPESRETPTSRASTLL